MVLIEPGPDAGEAWCVDCRLNEEKTLLIPANSARRHAEKHMDEKDDYKSFVRMKAAWPHHPREKKG